MSPSNRYDLVVIGSGPAGEKGAAQAAYFGKRVALVERARHLGGAGINTGTVPSKTLRESALYYSGLRQRGLYGADYSLKEGLTVGHFMYRERIVVENEWGIIQRNLDRHRIEVIHGEASLKDAHTVHVRTPDGAGRELTTEIILIATGSAPYHPPGIPFDGRVIFDSDSILRMQRIPNTMAVVGGGVIGSEYASIFTALGVEVTLVESGERLLPFVDREIAERLQARLSSLGLRFMFNDRVAAVTVADDRVRLRLQDGSELACDIALFAAGRQSNVEGLGLERVGIELGARGLIPVNERYQTRVPTIFAAGDVIGFPALASTSMEQARVAMVHAFDLKYKSDVAFVLPYGIYTIPEISTVGMSEEELTAKAIPYEVGRAFYKEIARGQIVGDLEGLMKLIFHRDTLQLLGVHIIGDGATELVHIGQAVLTYGGVDIVVSNAGTAHSSPVDRMELADWERSFAVNATGHFLVAREGMRVLKAQGLGGAFVFVATKNVMSPGKDFSAYSASKAAEAQLAKVLEIPAERLELDRGLPEEVATDVAMFTRAGVDNPPLHALVSGSDGLNGVYQYTSSGAFPDQSFQSTNYWVDVVFIRTDAIGTPRVLAVSPARSSSGVGVRPVRRSTPSTCRNSTSGITPNICRNCWRCLGFWRRPGTRR